MGARMPVLFLSHGGGPWPWVDGMREAFAVSAREFAKLPGLLPERPRAILVVSGHWEESEFTLATASHPPTIYDYSGFPPHTYQLKYPAPGAPETWPNSLRAVVRLVLASRFSMWMAWGPELTFFCNDAYRRDTLGEKYPWALGRPASEVWSEIWHDIGPRIDSVLTTGQATWDEQLMLFLERSGFTEETFHTFSYIPLADDDGGINGMLCVVSEDTEAVVASRRMRKGGIGRVGDIAPNDRHDWLLP